MGMLGIDGLLYVGTAGSTAATLVPEAQDVAYNIGIVTAKIRSRASRYASSNAVGNDPTVTFTLRCKSGEAPNATIRAAAHAGTAIAMRLLEKSGGAGIDADFVVSSFENGQPLEGHETYNVTVELNTDLRQPTIET